MRLTRMHAEVVLGTERPCPPEPLGDGLLRGVGDGRQGNGEVLRRVNVQGIAVPFTVGQGHLDALRLALVARESGQQPEGSVLWHGSPQIVVELSESLVPQGVLAWRNQAGLRAVVGSAHGGILHCGQPAAVAL